MALQYSSSDRSFRVSTVTGLALCFLVLLNNANSSSARLLLNTTREVFMSREQQLRRNLLDNGLGKTPPMGNYKAKVHDVVCLSEDNVNFGKDRGCVPQNLMKPQM